MSDQPPSPAPSPAKNNPPPPAPPAPWFQFGTPVLPSVRQLTTGHFSQTPNNQLNTLLFDNLIASLQAPDPALSAIVSAALEVPAKVLSNDPFLGYVADLRGVCSKSAGSRAVLMVQLGGVTYTQTFAYDNVRNGPWFAEVFSFERRPNKDSGQPGVPLPPLTINVLISVQRRTPEDSVQLTLDSIDLTADRP